MELELPTTPEYRKDIKVRFETGICSVEKRLESSTLSSPNKPTQINVIDTQNKICPQSFGNFSIVAQRFDSLRDFGPSQEPNSEFCDYGTKRTQDTPRTAQMQVTFGTPMDSNDSGHPKDKLSNTPQFSDIKNSVTPKIAGSNPKIFRRTSTLNYKAGIPAGRVLLTAKTGVGPKHSSIQDGSPGKKFQDRSSVNKIADHTEIANSKEKVVKDLLKKFKDSNILKLKNGIINTALAKNKKINRS